MVFYIMNIVIDTNVLISALKSKQGASYRLLIALPSGSFVPNVSVPLFLEYESVAKRKGLLSNLSAVQIDMVLDYLLSKSRIRKIFYLWRPCLKDPKDDLVLEVAVESKSKYIVTFKIKDFKGCNQYGIKAVTPQEFIKIRGI